MNGQQGVDATTVLTARLEAQQWNVVLAGLQELPLKLSGSVHAALMQQLQNPPLEHPAQPNGVDTAPNLNPLFDGQSLPG